MPFPTIFAGLVFSGAGISATPLVISMPCTISRYSSLRKAKPMCAVFPQSRRGSIAARLKSPVKTRLTAIAQSPSISSALKKCARGSLLKALAFCVQKLIWLAATSICATLSCTVFANSRIIKPVINGAFTLTTISRTAKKMPLKA